MISAYPQASDAKSTRKYASFVLGEMALPTSAVVQTLSSLLLNDESQYVRHCAAGALGCLGIRAFADDDREEGEEGVAGPMSAVGAAVAAMIRSLEVEENRVDVSVRQGLGLKECAPDDLCDICEGSTWHVGEQGYALEPRLRPVRALS
jgi:hypothetical protein|eukprot:SAG25_NODE_6013_length_596_cov_1.338028_1_plen_149_part_00